MVYILTRDWKGAEEGEKSVFKSAALQVIFLLLIAVLWKL